MAMCLTVVLAEYLGWSAPCIESGLSKGAHTVYTYGCGVQIITLGYQLNVMTQWMLSDPIHLKNTFQALSCDARQAYVVDRKN